MNNCIRKTYLMLAACTFGIGPLSATPAPSGLNLDVRSEGKADFKRDSKKQTRHLAIVITNNSKVAASGLKLKWILFGHTMKDRKLVTLKSGELSLSVDAGKSVTTSTPDVTISGEREHSEPVVNNQGVNRNNARGRQVTFKTIPASGEQYYGFAVTVYQGASIVAESSSHPSLSAK